MRAICVRRSVTQRRPHCTCTPEPTLKPSTRYRRHGACQLVSAGAHSTPEEPLQNQVARIAPRYIDFLRLSADWKAHGHLRCCQRELMPSLQMSPVAGQTTDPSATGTNIELERTFHSYFPEPADCLMFGPLSETQPFRTAEIDVLMLQQKAFAGSLQSSASDWRISVRFSTPTALSNLWRVIMDKNKILFIS